MKIKIETATPEKLDWLVSVITNPDWTEDDRRWNTYDYADIGDPDDEQYSPTTNWKQGGPIIESECITLTPHDAASSTPRNPDYWEAMAFDADSEFTQYGPTPLIAAMRCFVASEMGDEVEVPDTENDPY